MNMLLGNILSQLDYRVVYIFVGIVFISAILAIIKRAIKIGIVVIIIALSMSTLGPMAKNFQDTYKFSVNNGIATIKTDSGTVTLDKNTIKNLQLINGGVNGYELKVTYADGLTDIKIPSFMAALVKDYTNKYNIPAQITD